MQQTCHEASHNKLNGEHLAFLHDGNIGVWNGQQSICGDMLCPLHPPGASLVENLTLQISTPFCDTKLAVHVTC